MKSPPAGTAALVALLLLASTAALGGAAAPLETDDGGPIVRFGMVADNHYDTFPVGEKAPWQSMQSWHEEQRRRMTTTTKRRYDIAKDKMLEAIDVFNKARGTTFVVNLGDLVNNDLMWNLKPILDAFNTAKAPHFSILGNHDLRAHNDRFGKNNRTQEAWIRAKLGLGDTWYYSFSIAAFHFVFLDSMLLDERNDPKRAVLVTWLEKELQGASDRGQAVIVFGHISIGIATNPIGPTLKACPHVVAAFFGHEHRGGYALQGAVHTVILNGQIETLTNAFAVADVYPDRIELTGFGRVQSRVLRFVNPETKAMVARTLEGIAAARPGGKLPSSGSHDLSAVGHTPAPPSALWGPNDGQERMPDLNLNIVGYRKPRLTAAEPNPGDTQFILEYKKWPPRFLTAAPEDRTDLGSGTAQRGKHFLAYPLEDGGDVATTKAPQGAAAAGQPPPSHTDADISSGDAPPRDRGTKSGSPRMLPRATAGITAATGTTGAAGGPDAADRARSSLPLVSALTAVVGCGTTVLLLQRRRRLLSAAHHR